MAEIIPTDDQLIAALGTGGRTRHVADRLKIGSRRPYVLRRMRKLEAQGKVRRHDRYSYDNDIYWEPVPA